MSDTCLPTNSGLGGSSNLNFLIYLRGHAKDFDHWANVTGDSRWSYENVMTFFKKSEDYKYKGAWDSDRRKFHATGGYLNVQEPSYTGLASTFLKAGAELGFPEVDLNGNFTQGLFWTEFLQNICARIR
jgi:choline dehydrogenase